MLIALTMDLDSLILNMLCENISDISSDSSSSSLSSSDSFIEQVPHSDSETKKKNVKYVEDVVHNYSDEQFKTHFRMNRETVSMLTEKIAAADILPTHGFGREKILPQKAILITLRYLTHLETFRQISDRFHVSPSSVHRVLRKVVSFLVAVMHEYIRFPDEKQAAELEQCFDRMYGIQGVMGILDACHIKIKRPVIDDELYRNKNGVFAIHLQAVIDCDLKFIDIYCGEPGAKTKSAVLKKSALYGRAAANPQDLFGDRFVIGDVAYPPLNWLITPVSAPLYLTEEEEEFNGKHATTRNAITDAFSILKSRFRRLISFENSNIRFIVQCVTACCVLHNICIINSDFVDQQHNLNQSENKQEVLPSDSKQMNNKYCIGNERQS